MENPNQFSWGDNSNQQQPNQCPYSGQQPTSSPNDPSPWEPLEEQPQPSTQESQPNNIEWDWRGPEEISGEQQPPQQDSQTPIETNVPQGINNPNHTRTYGIVGNIVNLQIHSTAYSLNEDNEQILNEINKAGLTPIGKNNDNRFKLSNPPESTLKDVLTTISQIAESRNQSVADVFFYRIPKGESSSNIFRGKPNTNFIYFVNATYDSGDIVLDLSSVGGPSVKAIDSNPSLLVTLEGWVPYNISRNNGDQDLIAIAGSFN